MSREGLLPLFFTDCAPEIGRRLFPALGVFSFVDEVQPRRGGLLRRVLGGMIGSDIIGRGRRPGREQAEEDDQCGMKGIPFHGSSPFFRAVFEHPFSFRQALHLSSLHHWH